MKYIIESCHHCILETEMAAIGITPEQMQNLLQNISKTGSMLLIDCRSFLAYNSGHISSAHNVHCPPIVKRRAGGSLSLQNIMRCSESRSRLKSGYFSTVVVYDDRTLDLQNLNSDSILSLVLKGLSEHIPGIKVNYLYGGFDAFNSLSPEWCTSHISSDSECVMTSPPVKEYMVTSPTVTSRDTTATSPILKHMQGDTIKYRPSQDQGDPEAILPWLFLGSAYHATQERRLQTLGINALLSLSRTHANAPSAEFLNRCIGVDDDCMTDIRCWFPEAIDFIESVRKNGGKVLVHCHAGISRSATVCIAYIMWLKHWTMEGAYQFLKSKRSLIAPNLNFMRQLVEFESELEENGRGSTSTHSSTSSYASAIACVECDALPLADRPCAVCRSELEGGARGSNPHHPALRRTTSDTSDILSAQDIFSSPCGHFEASTSSSKTNFPFDQPHSHHLLPHHHLNRTHSAPQSASAVLLSGLAMGTAPPSDATSPRPPNTAHPKLLTLPLTTCAQQVFSFDSSVVTDVLHQSPHTNSPTVCHSPLLSPG